jgi:hypothetical protein
MYLTSPSRENSDCFLNNSDIAQSQKLKTKYTVLDRNPQLSVISHLLVWHIWAIIKKFKAAQRKLYRVNIVCSNTAIA